MIDLLEHILQEQASDFMELFQPLSSEEFEGRIISYIESVCTKNPDGTYSTEKDVDLSDKGLVRIPVKFKYVGGYFVCCSNKLTSLQGAPKEVGGDFDCGNNNLTSLQGAPERVGGDFECWNNKLTTLQGAPERVGRSFRCFGNPVSVKELKKTVKREYLE